MTKINSGKLFTVLSLSLIFTILMSLTCFDASCQEIRESVLRLHVIANSDSNADQSVKLKVRDALLDEFGQLFNEAQTIADAEEVARQNVDYLQNVAEQTLKAQGFDYGVKVEIAPSDFGTREYDEKLTLPAGEYMAVRVLLGEAKGQNWWCVCFPNICMGSVAKEINTVLDSNGQRIVKNGQKLKIKFKVVEIYEKIKTKLK